MAGVAISFPVPAAVKDPWVTPRWLTLLDVWVYTKDEMTAHGFRSMASTLLNEKGYNRDWIERQLAHSERNNVRAAYNYAEYLPERRQMMQDWADYLMELKLKAQYKIVQ